MKYLRISIVLFILIALTSGCGGTEINPTPEASLTPEETPTPTPEPAISAKPTPTPEVIEYVPMADHLVDVPISTFFDEAFNLIMLRDPEWMVELGMGEMLEEEPGLTDFSPEYLAATNQMNEELLAILQGYDYGSLSQTEKISYQVMENFLLAEIQNYQNMAYEYLVTPLSVRSWPQLFVMFFTDSHPLNSQADAEAYVARTGLLGNKIDQLIAQLDLQAQAGIIPPKLVLEYGISDARNYFGGSAMSSPIVTHFLSASSEIEDLPSDQRDVLINQLETVVKDEVLPAYQRLNVKLAEMLDKAPDVISLSTYDGGLAYYETLLHHFITLDLTADEVHTMGLKELERIQAEMRNNFSVLGYDTSLSFPELYEQMAAEAGTLVGEEVTKEYERILQTADEELGEYFDLRPEGALEVVGGDSGAYYSPGSLDGSRPGMFYAIITYPQEVYKMRTIAYHEGIPGHHYQITLAAAADLPLFRNLLIFDGYTEGWALYAEYLAAELGWYADDPYGDLGRLQYEALRACRMAADTGIHAKGWTYQEAVDFLVDNTGLPRRNAEYEVIRYISYPGQAPAYMAGKIEILRLRGMAEEALGENFDLRQFHNIVLENGSMPLYALEDVIMNWIESY